MSWAGALTSPTSQLVGGCPVAMAFSSKRYSREIRLEAALFIGAMCRTSLLTVRAPSEPTEQSR